MQCTKKPLKIGLIDDDSDIRAQLTEILRENGHTVLPFCSGMEMYKAYPDFGFDLIITDLVMPDMDGIEIIGRFRENRKSRGGGKLIAISGASQKDIYLQMAKKLGADAVLQKPFAGDELLACIESLYSDDTNCSKA